MANCKHCGISGHHTGTCQTMSGKRFGSLVVLRAAECRNKPYLLCRCDCGVEKEVRIDHLRNGATMSCGCGKATSGQIQDRADPTQRFTLFGEEMTLGEVAEASGKRPDQIWKKIRHGYPLEVAAFGKNTADFIKALAVEKQEPSARADEAPECGHVEDRLAKLDAALGRLTKLEAAVDRLTKLEAVVRRIEASVATMRASAALGAAA